VKENNRSFSRDQQKSQKYFMSAESSVLGAFAKLRRATISFVMSVRMEQLGSHWVDFD
jgi:hypothetical protein